MRARIRYELSFPRPSNHLVDVGMTIEGAQGPYVDLILPSWIPGSYRIRDFARHVQDFRGAPYRKLAKDCWRVETGGRAAVRVRYRVYCFEMSVRTSHVDASHAFLNPASICLYVDGRRGEPHEVRIRAPRGWRVATGLPGRGGAWRAASYDHLVDCPIEVSRFLRRRFRVRGRTHEFVLHGKGNCDIAVLVRDTEKIVRETARLFGGLPYERYVFLMHAVEDGYGGLEHENSCAMQAPRFGFAPRENARRVRHLIAHEFFHTWNVKRIRPPEFFAYDYRREVYTDLLWLLEGVTNYYAFLIPARAGLLAADEARATLAEWWNNYRRKPGRFAQSVSEASFDSWIRLYQPDEQNVNRTISYYEKGQLVGLVLDMEIRRRSGGRRSLDDVMRALWSGYARRGRPVTSEVVQREAERAAGSRLDGFFRAYVGGTEELPFDRALAVVGLRAVPEGRQNARAWLGLVADRGGDRMVVREVLAGSPAERGGLSARDEIVAIEGVKATREVWDRALEAHPAGRALRITVFRDGILREVRVRPTCDPVRPVRIEAVPDASAAVRREHRRWLGQPWKGSS